METSKLVTNSATRKRHGLAAVGSNVTLGVCAASTNGLLAEASRGCQWTPASASAAARGGSSLLHESATAAFRTSQRPSELCQVVGSAANPVDASGSLLAQRAGVEHVR